MHYEMLPLLVLGAGGHGKVVADALLAAGKGPDGFVDDRRAHGEKVLGIPVVGDLRWLRANPARIALAIGSNAARRSAAVQIVESGSILITVVHPAAVVSPSAQIGAGTVVMAGAVINADARVGRGTIINTGAIVEHDCIVGDFAHISPRASMAGGCQLGESAHLGIAAAMLPGTSVGARTIVGGGGLVARDLPMDVVARGIPARISRTIR